MTITTIYQKNHFTCATQALVTTTVGLATTYTGLCVSNPKGSTNNLNMTLCRMMQSVLQSTQVEGFGLAIGSSTTTDVVHTTPTNIISSGTATGITSAAKADTACTLPVAPVYLTWVTNTGSAATNASGGAVDLQGDVILFPGSFLLWVTPTQASVAGMWFSFSWFEIPAPTYY